MEQPYFNVDIEMAWTNPGEPYKVIPKDYKRKIGSDAPDAKPVNQYNMYGKLIREWGSLSEVQGELGFHPTAIGRAAKGHVQYAYGFIWKYKSDVV